MDRKLDIEDLVAWMDGELSGPEAQRVAELVETDPAWREAFGQFSAVDRLAGLIEPVSPRRDLTDRIVRAATRRKSRLIRVARIAAPLAAAACIIVALQLGGPDQKPVTEAQSPVGGVASIVAAILKDVPAEDQFIVQNLTLFRNYDEVTQYQQVRDLADAETLSALIEIDNSEEM
ncbi:MAG: hypothetical protein KAV00_03035 [Phycisphaerae bacterium]|nr:hypothetical protein [Phycisphaerae bacterium]